MKYALYSLPERPAGRTGRALSSGGSTVQFGDEVLVVTANNEWDDSVAEMAAMGARQRSDIGSARKSDLHLVVQKGRTFQAEHPDTEVILDRGRFLVVAMPWREARQIAGRQDPCFQIQPLLENAVVFERRPRPRPRTPRDLRLDQLAAALDAGAFHADLAWLTGLHTRHSLSDGFDKAAAWAEAALTSLGLETARVPVAVGEDGGSYNVTALKRGVGPAPRRCLVVGAHLDSVNARGGQAAAAPGADDNASGSAGAIALARALAPHVFLHDIEFVLFGGEEQGLFGSRAHVTALGPGGGDAILGMLNMDMIGTLNTERPTVLLEGAALSQAMIEALAEAAAQTQLEVQVSLNPFASDHVPFIEAGIPAVLTIEGADGANDAVHTVADTLDRIDQALPVEILRMNLAFCAAAAGFAEVEALRPAPAGRVEPRPAGSTPTVPTSGGPAPVGPPPVTHAPVQPPTGPAPVGPGSVLPGIAGGAPGTAFPPPVIPLAPSMPPIMPTGPLSHCGCAGCGAAALLALHLDGLLAQLIRLHAAGRLAPADYDAWTRLAAVRRQLGG